MKNFLFMIALVMLCSTILFALAAISFPQFGKLAFITFLALGVFGTIYIVWRYIADKFNIIDAQLEEYMRQPVKKHSNSCFANQDWYATRD